MVNEKTSLILNELTAFYGDGSNGSCPTLQQWQWVLNLPSDTPLTLVNFFKMRDIADYTDTGIVNTSPISGHEAFGKYAGVSRPILERVGGRFLHVGPFGHSFIGTNEDWDMVAIGSYPNKSCLFALFEDTTYQEAYGHRTAACLRQKTLIS